MVNQKTNLLTAENSLCLQTDSLDISSADGVRGALVSRVLELLLEDRQEAADPVVQSNV